jgi:hypothetical protein
MNPHPERNQGAAFALARIGVVRRSRRIEALVSLGLAWLAVLLGGPASAFWPFRRIRWELRVHLDTARGTRTVSTPLDVVPVKAP